LANLLFLFAWAGANVIFVLAQMAWVGGTALILFLGIKYTLGLRINNEIEEVYMLG